MVAFACACFGAAGVGHAAERLSDGLVVLYDFEEPSGQVVHDRSGAGQPLDLRIEKPNGVRFRDGALVVDASTVIRSPSSAAKVHNALMKSSALTIEAWVKPRDTKQDGPARIVSLSGNTSERNFTLGQEGGQYDFRLRARSTSNNGMPSIASPRNSVRTALTHLVYTRDKAGAAKLYINGKQSASRKVDGDLGKWNGGYRLLLANEQTGDRPWRGELHLVAIYDRALPAKDVARNFGAGAADSTTQAARADSARLFDHAVAPLLARHCLECHGWKSTKGKLDLSRRETALTGGKTGRAIVPGKSADSLAWNSVLSNEMPDGRPPLSRDEKTVLRQWIDNGAVWTKERLDPSDYARERFGDAVWVQRLTVAEYIETVRVAVGVDIADDARKLLPRDLRADGFNNTAYNLNVDLGHVEAYARLAQLIAQRMDARAFAARFTSRRDQSDATMSTFIAKAGKWLLRGPLSASEVAAYRRVAQAVAKEGGGFDEAVRYVVEAMLQSPRFIYRMERQRGDGKPRPVSDHELASRLSYILWGAPPDEALFSAAEAGALRSTRSLSAQVTRMLKDPRAVDRSLRFAEQWLNLDRLNYLRPNRDRYPNWDPLLAADMRAETLAYFKEIAWTQRRPLVDLLNAQVTFATPRLAAHYGLKPRGTGLAKYDLRSTPSRGGLLTQASVLTVGGDEASMVTRGLFVLHDVLRGKVEDPPPGIDTTPVPTKPGLSQRLIAQERLANPACGGCHAKFEPFAFGLERFDGLGAYHEKDHHGNTLRDDGQIVFPGTKQPIAYRSAAQLMDLLAASDHVSRTITWKVAQFALGRPLGEADKPVLDKIHQQSRAAGGTYEALITAIVTSDLVRMTRTESTP